MKKQVYKEKALERDIILFKWKTNMIKLPLNPEFYVTEMGSLGWDLVHQKWVKGSWTGELDDEGDYTTFVALTLATTPQTYTLKNHEEVIVCGNTPLYRPFGEEREFYAMMKSETDDSILAQLINSRLNKAFIAYSDQQKKQIEIAYEAFKTGAPMVIVTTLLQGIETADLTDPDEIEKMQYLSSFFKEIDKREANDAGIDMNSIDKRAQVNNVEMNQNEDVTSLEYLVMYEMRQRFVEEMRAAGITDFEIVKNPVFFDEPTSKDIENGTFEAVKDNEETPEEAPKEPKEEEADDGNKEN